MIGSAKDAQCSTLNVDTTFTHIVFQLKVNTIEIKISDPLEPSTPPHLFTVQATHVAFSLVLTSMVINQPMPHLVEYTGKVR